MGERNIRRREVYINGGDGLIGFASHGNYGGFVAAMPSKEVETYYQKKKIIDPMF